MGRPKKTSIMSMAGFEDEEIDGIPAHVPKKKNATFLAGSKLASRKRGSGDSDEDAESTSTKEHKMPVKKRTNTSKRPVLEEDCDTSITSEKPKKPVVRQKKTEKKNDTEEREVLKPLKKPILKKSFPGRGKKRVPETQNPIETCGSEEDMEVQERKAVPVKAQTAKNVKEIVRTELANRNETSDEEIEDLEVPKPKKEKTVISKRDNDQSKVDEASKFNIMTKYTALEKRYDTLKQLKETEVERNFAKYKKLSEQRFKASDEVIKSLQAQLASKSAVTEDIKNAKKTSKVEKAEIQSLKEQLSLLKEELLQTKNTLQITTAKLATRKENNSSNGMPVFKEDLYADLTGLIIRDIKHSPEKTVYDCIQTGRNRTIHYKLSLNNLTNQTEYIPLLDPNRDKHLIDLLPDYLAEEIQFEREQAGSFFHRLCGVLQKRVQVEVDEDEG